MRTAMIGTNGMPMLVHDWSPGVERSWISIGDKLPDDFPEYFTTEDMEAAGLEPDWQAMAKAENQIREIRKWSE